VKYSDGTVQSLYGNSMPQREADGSILWHGFITDITERKEAEACMTALALRNETLLQMASDGIHVLDSEGRVLEVNTAFCAMLGYTREELLQLNASDWDMQWSEAELRQRIGELFQRQAVFETQHRRKDGVIRDVEINGVGVELDGQRYLYAAARDITQRKQAEKEILASEARLREIINVSPVPMALNDEEQRVTYLNPAFVRMFGYTVEDIPTLTDWWVTAYPDLDYRQWVGDTWQAELDRAKREQTPFSPLEVTARCKDGTSRTALASAASLSGSFEGNHLVVLYDITERKEAEEEQAKLEAENRQLQKAESLGRMAGAIAHHFNNQLLVVAGNLELALDMLPPSAASQYLAEAALATHRASDVSTQMLTYLGQTYDERAPLDLSAACRQNLSMLRVVAPAGTTLDTDLHRKGLVIKANANHIQQVLTNLLTNAWESSSDDACVVRLSVKRASASDISEAHRYPVGAGTGSADYACLEVADTGGGIAAADMDKLFDPFFSTKFAGRGLGLAVVAGIVRAHHGVITVESEPGVGSVFRMYIPLAREASALA
jgi:PAS domain S-box-containing protein